MGVCDIINHWGTTTEERRGRYPCDNVLPEPELVLFRAVTIDAPPAVVYRWLCQLKVAPYSYDLLDNLGRRSPQQLTRGVDELAVGEPVMVFTLASFVTDEHLTISIRDHRTFGDIAMSYVTRPEGTERTRLLGKVVAVLPRNLLGAAMRRLLPAGDLVMMRRQLLNLKRLAEATTVEALEARS